MQVIPKTLVANTDTDFEFDIKGWQFLVKNFTTGDITVKFYPSTDEIIIPTMCSQTVVGNLNKSYDERTDKLIINSIAGGKVEAQCIEY